MQFPVKQFETRFLLPFLFDYTKIRSFVEHLKGVRLMQSDAWQLTSLRSEYLDNVFSYLPLYEPSLGSFENGAYLKLNPQLDRHLIATTPESDDTLRPFAARRGCELFLSAYGTGVLSIALHSKTPLATIEQVRAFNSRLHYGKEWLSRNPERVFPLASNIIDFSPTVQNLPTLCEGLLEGATPGGHRESEFGITATQRSMSLYTAVRLDGSVDFGVSSTRDAILTNLIGLQMIWPTDHCGTVQDAITANQSILINRKMWMGVGSLGAAALVADQATPGSNQSHRFDLQRLDQAIDKWFLPYLIAMQQRLAIQAFKRESIELSQEPSGSNENAVVDPLGYYHRLAPLRKAMVHFALRGQIRQISDEDNTSRWFRECRQAFEIDEAAAGMDAILTDIDRQLSTQELIAQNESQSESFEEQVRLHEKVEWIEVFIVSVYSVEMAHVIGDGFVTHERSAWPLLYPGTTLILVALTTLVVMMSALGLWPKKQTESGGFNWLLSKAIAKCDSIGKQLVGGKRRWALVWILLAIAIHLAIGLASAKPH